MAANKNPKGAGWRVECVCLCVAVVGGGDGGPGEPGSPIHNGYTVTATKILERCERLLRVSLPLARKITRRLDQIHHHHTQHTHTVSLTRQRPEIMSPYPLAVHDAGV